MNYATQEEVILKIEGMSCSGCSNRIHQNLITIHGIVDSRVNHKKGRATVTYKPDRIDPRIIIEKIQELGFTAEEVE